MVTLRGRVSMNSTASATSFGSIRRRSASASSSFSFGQSLEQRRDDRAGRDGADADAVLEDLAPQRVHEGLHRVLGGGVDRLPARPERGPRRAGHDDVAGSALDHVRQDGMDRAGTRH